MPGMLVFAPVLLLAQAVERVTLPDPDANSFDLAKVKPYDQAGGCAANPVTGDDIVVCGRRKAMDIDVSRLPDYAEKPIRAAVDLPGGARVGVEAESIMLGGVKSNRAMVKLKIPF